MKFPGYLAGILSLISVVCCCPPAYAQVALNQVDNFSSGTTQGWAQGLGSSGLAIVTGGPGGGSDNHMRITSAGGVGAGSRMIAFNQAQWTGDYNAAGVTGISMDLRGAATNAGALPMRLAFRDAATGAGYSSNAISVPNDGAWHSVLFLLAASEFTGINSPSQSFTDFLSATTELRLLASLSPSLLGDPMVAVVGVDNIRAVPEPLGVLALSALSLFAFRRRTRKAYHGGKLGLEGVA